MLSRTVLPALPLNKHIIWDSEDPLLMVMKKSLCTRSDAFILTTPGFGPRLQIMRTRAGTDPTAQEAHQTWNPRDFQCFEECSRSGTELINNGASRNVSEI